MPDDEEMKLAQHGPRQIINSDSCLLMRRPVGPMTNTSPSLRRGEEEEEEEKAAAAAAAAAGIEISY